MFITFLLWLVNYYRNSQVTVSYIRGFRGGGEGLDVKVAHLFFLLMFLKKSPYGLVMLGQTAQLAAPENANTLRMYTVDWSF